MTRRTTSRAAAPLGDAARPTAGPPIGRGRVGGRRVEHPGARGRGRRAKRLAARCGTFQSATREPDWDHRLN